MLRKETPIAGAAAVDLESDNIHNKIDELADLAAVYQKRRSHGKGSPTARRAVIRAAMELTAAVDLESGGL